MIDKETNTSSASAAAPSVLLEADVWRAVGAGWRQLHGSFRELGFSFEWHDFEAERPFDWAKSFHPGSIEICLNLAGNGLVSDGKRRVEFTLLSAGFYRQIDGGLVGRRDAGQRHQFITVEFSQAFLRRYLLASETRLHPMVRALVGNGDGGPLVSETIRLTAEHQQLVASLRQPPVFVHAQRAWYYGKALEVAACFFYQPPPEEELFCQRQKRLNLDRVDRVIAVLKSDLAEPPSLEELGRRVGCSPFHLSRIFSQGMGRTISRYLRELRMDKAAELLRSGKFNVTEVALEVGYSSPGHFSTAFHETFGCCPGLYPLTTATQRTSKRTR